MLDYGSGNLRSAQRALARVGAHAEITADLGVAVDADGLVVPGVGAFAECMAGLRKIGGDRLIAKRLAASRPVLGICVGMQVLFTSGVEHGVRTAGCARWHGRVERLNAPILPHMGWNTVQPAAGSALFAGLGTGTRFYFVHSYAVRVWNQGDACADPARQPAYGREPLVTWAKHGEQFVAAVEDVALAATQFHPEKSGDAGAALLRNWLDSL